MKYLFLIYLAFSLKSCTPLAEDFFSIDVVNETDTKLFFYEANEIAQVYPDTTVVADQERLRQILPMTTASFGSGSPWDEEIERLPSDTLSVFIFSSDTLNTFPYSEIRDDYKILKRYDLSIEDLELLNFKVTFPPTQQMQNIRQFPPYEQ